MGERGFCRQAYFSILTKSPYSIASEEPERKIAFHADSSGNQHDPDGFVAIFSNILHLLFLHFFLELQRIN